MGVSTRQVGQWFRIFRNKGLDELCTLHYQGDPGRLGPAQVERLKQEIEGAVPQRRAGPHLDRGDLRRDLLGLGRQGPAPPDRGQLPQGLRLLLEGGRQEAEAVRAEVSAARRAGGADDPALFRGRLPPGLGRGACSIPAGCWSGQRFYVGVGNGRKRLNILGAYSPDDHDYVDLRLTRENITGEQFVKLLEALRAKHPETAKFIALPGQCAVLQQAVVKEWLAAHREFRLGAAAGLLAEPEPDRAAVEVPEEEGVEPLAQDVRGDAGGGGGGAGSIWATYRDELSTLMTEGFQIVEVEEAAA